MTPNAYVIYPRVYSRPLRFPAKRRHMTPTDSWATTGALGFANQFGSRHGEGGPPVFRRPPWVLALRHRTVVRRPVIDP